LAAPMMAASAAPVVANFRRVGFMVFSCARSTARKRRADIPVPREPRQELPSPENHRPRAAAGSCISEQDALPSVNGT
jgi:hypothetical protein